jgi:WD40 repeat protein
MRNSGSDTALPGFERSLAVVIGINAYSHGIPPLHNAVRDANAVADSLERQGFEVLRLLDSQATLSSLSSLLSHHLSSLSSPPDRLLLYFAGHGLAHTDEQHQLSGFLLPSDARRDDTSSYWPMAALREALRHLPCRHLLLILDCCFAGAFPHPSSRDIRAPSLPAPLYLERFRHFSSRRSFQLLLSTAHDELASDRLLAKPAQESLGDGLHSPFALALLQGLEPSSLADTNQDGLLTAAELYTFLRDRLLSLVPSHCQQTPSLWHLDWHDGGEFLFLLSDSDAFPALPPAAPLSPHSNPYLGLRPFSSAQRHLFFGRERLVDSLLERLRSQPLLLLCGPSGAGKSSLVHAGLLPRLSEEPSWRIPPSLRPSSQPFQALSSWLSSLVPDSSAPSASTLTSRPRSAADFLGSFLSRHPERSVLLVIDPLEELVTACLDDSLRKAFLRVLSGLLQLSHPRFRLLLLLRSDFEPHFLSLLQPASLPFGVWHGGRLQLPPMNRDELRRCIEKPAEACVLFFSPGLVERLLDDVEQMPGALPLLSVALSELFGAYLASGRNDRTLSFEDYHHIGGGIAGALQRRAELVFSGMPPPSTEGQPALPPVPPSELPAFQRTLRNVLLRMVSPEGGELARRRVPRSELEYPHRKENARVQRALRTLEASRLVVASDDAGPCVEPAHDALLSAWPRLHDWARHAQRELLLLRRISHAAFEWHRHHRSSDFLWADARLDQLGVALTSPRGDDEPLALTTASPGSQPTEPLAFNAEESGFLRASATRRRFLRTRRGVLALTLAMMLVALTVAALFQADRANFSAREAQLQQRAAEISAEEARKQKEAAEANALEARKQEGLAATNASEAQRQQEAAEANFQEARKQQEAAAANAREAQQQQKVAEANLQEAQRQQQLADANAKEALTQRNTSEANAREAQRQQEAAEANARETRRQQQLADANAREALTQRNTSEANAAEARKQQEAAETNAREAQRQQQIADTNALEARKQQEAAETNFREARKQQETADASAREAQRQREAAETHLGEARRQQQLADTYARDALAQRNFADANAREAREQQEAAIASAREAQKQKDLVLASARVKQVDRLIEEDPTKALLVLLEVNNQSEAPDSPWHQTVLDLSQHAISSAILSNGGSVYEARFSPDGSRVLTASSDGTARIWRTDGKGEPLILKGHDEDEAVFSATFSPDGSLVLTASRDGTTRIWRTDGKGEPLILKGHHAQEVTSATFSPDGSRVLTISDDGTARSWRTDGKGEPHLFVDTDYGMSSATFSPDGSRVLTASWDGTVRIWRTDGKGEPLLLKGHTEEVTSATFSPDGSLVLTSSHDGTARIWRTEGAGEPRILKGHDEAVNSATFSPDGSLVLTASDDGTARIWCIDGNGEPLILKSHDEAVTYATFSPDGSLVLTVSNDGTARVWPADGKGEPLILKGHDEDEKIFSATFSPDGSRVLTASGDGTARVWPADGKGEPLILKGHREAVFSATFSPDGSRVLTASGDGTTRIWRTDGAGESLILKGHRESVNSAIFSPDGTRILTASADGTARIWRSDGAGESLILARHDESEAVVYATFSPDGSRVLTGSNDGTVRIWQADGSKELFILVGHVDSVYSATFNPDDSHVFTDSGDDTARIWHVDAEEQIRSLVLRKSGHEAFLLPDGSGVLTLSKYGLVYIWPIEPLPLLNSFSKATTACLSTNERVSHLFETLDEARKGHELCEQSHGRLP